MNLLKLDAAQRAPFARLTAGLVHDKGFDPNEVFLNVLESEEAPEMNYWMTLVLVQEHYVSAQKEVGKDAAGESVKPLQAACLLKNLGVVAALLELEAFTGSVMDKDFQLCARIAAQHEDQAILGVLMKFAEEKGALEAFMKTMQGASIQ